MDNLEKINPNILQEYQTSYRPYFDYRRDYQTDAPSYYDYLGNLNNIFTSIIETINKQVDYVKAIADKDIKIEDTETIKLIMQGDFKVDNQILLKGRLRISDNIESKSYNNKTFDIRNAIIVKDDGIYIRDYTEVIEYLSSLIKANTEIINNHSNDIHNLQEYDKESKTSFTQVNNRIEKVETNVSDLTESVSDLTSSGKLATSDEVSKVKADLVSLNQTVQDNYNYMITGFQTVASTNKKVSDLAIKLNEKIQSLETRVSKLEK